MNRHFSNWYDIQIFGEFDPPKKNIFAGFPADRVGQDGIPAGID